MTVFFMKIVVLGTRGFPGVQGGVETHCENLYPRLAAKNCDVIVFTRAQYVNPSIKEFKGVKLIPLTCPKNKFLEAFWHTLKGVFAAKGQRPRIVHIHAAGPSLFTPMARMLGMNVVITNHGPEHERKKWAGFPSYVLRIAEYLSCIWANRIISISESNAERLRKRYKKEVVVIPNGVEVSGIAKTDGALKRYGIEKGRYVLAVGRFVPEKGFHDLIKAFEIALDRGIDPRNDLKLVIVGRADHEDRYSKELKEKTARNPNVILTGFLIGQPLAELYSHAGLFVLPSYYEGLPIVLLEALSYGLSCIISDIPANREVIKLSEERFFKSGDIDQLANKIRAFINRPFKEDEKACQISEILKKYDWQIIANKTFQVYKKAINNS